MMEKRINGIPGAEDEIAAECLEKAKKEVRNVGVDLYECEFVK